MTGWPNLQNVGSTYRPLTGNKTLSVMFCVSCERHCCR